MDDKEMSLANFINKTKNESAGIIQQSMDGKKLTKAQLDEK